MEEITPEYIVAQSKVLTDEELLALINSYRQQERVEAEDNLYGDFNR